jgi:hypothetical protein
MLTVFFERGWSVIALLSSTCGGMRAGSSARARRLNTLCLGVWVNLLSGSG